MKNKRGKARGKGYGVSSQVLWGSLIIFVVLVFSSLYLIAFSADPFDQADAHARQVAQDVAGLKTIDQVGIYKGSQVYYSVLGEDASDQASLVLIPEEGSQVSVLPLANGVSQAQAVAVAKEQGASTIDHVVAGIEDQKVVWEVRSGAAYYLIDFATGAFVKKEGL